MPTADLQSLPGDILRLLADFYVDRETRQLMRCLNRQFHTTIPSAPSVGPCIKSFRKYSWKRFVCWWCLNICNLSDLDETIQGDWLLDQDTYTDSHTFLEYDTASGQWYSYVEPLDQLSFNKHVAPLFCNDCYGMDTIPSLMFDVIHSKQHLSRNIIANQNRCAQDLSSRFAPDFSHMSVLYLEALRLRNVSLCFPHSPIAPQNPVFNQSCSINFRHWLLTWNHCPECHWHGQSMDRCPLCKQVFHIGGDSLCHFGAMVHQRCQEAWKSIQDRNFSPVIAELEDSNNKCEPCQIECVTCGTSIRNILEHDDRIVIAKPYVEYYNQVTCQQCQIDH